MGQMGTIDKAAHIDNIVHSIAPKPRHGITSEGYLAIARDFHLDISKRFL